MKIYFIPFFLLIILSISSCTSEEDNDFDFLLTGSAVGSITGTRSDNVTPINARFNLPYSNFNDGAMLDEDDQVIVVKIRKSGLPVFISKTSYIDFTFYQPINESNFIHDTYAFYLDYSEKINDNTEFNLKTSIPDGGLIVDLPEIGPLNITNFKQTDGFVSFDYEIIIPAKYNSSKNDCTISGSAKTAYIKEIIN